MLIDAILAGSLLGVWNGGFSLFYGCYVADTFQNYGSWQPSLYKVQVLKHSAKREPSIALIFLVQITWISIIFSQQDQSGSLFQECNLIRNRDQINIYELISVCLKTRNMEVFSETASSISFLQKLRYFEWFTIVKSVIIENIRLFEKKIP